MLALRSSTDKGDFGKWLIWNLLEESETGEPSAFGDKQDESVYVYICVCP
jgi:hypothetical protein